MAKSEDTGKIPLSHKIHSPESRELAAVIHRNFEAILDAWFDNQLNADLIRKWGISGLENADRNQLRNSFLRPLLSLLREYLGKGTKTCLYGYLDERLRYAPHRLSLEDRAAYFRSIIPSDIQAIVEFVANKESCESYLQILAHIHAPLTDPDTGERIEILALGDCLMNEIRLFLPSICSDCGLNVDVRCIYFSAVVGKAISTDEITEYIHNNRVDLVAMSFMSYAGIPAYSTLMKECDRLTRNQIDGRVEFIINLIHAFIETIRTITKSPFLLHNTSGLPLSRYRKRLPFLDPLSRNKVYTLDKLNAGIGELIEHSENTILVDERSVSRANKHRKCDSSVFSRRVVGKGFFHTSWFGYYISGYYIDIINAYKKYHNKKVIMVDFDNTLWDGVMADGDVIHHTDRQSLLRDLKESGMLLVAVSKNTSDNIRWDELQLVESDFVLHKINWNLKAQSILEAVKELNIGMDSVIFIDDNPAELGMVQEALPEIQVEDANNPALWHGLGLLTSFPNTSLTEESRSRTEMYRLEMERRKSLDDGLDYETMMGTLELQLEFRSAEKSDTDRLYELVTRTNQFNTTTIRYSKRELSSMLSDTSYRIYVGKLRDKYGALGIVATVMLRIDGDVGEIISFIMSCRAMGFGVEQQMLYEVIAATDHAAKQFSGRYIRTDRNNPCSGLFANNHFKRISDEEWLLDTGSSTLPEPVSWITVIS